MAYQGGYIEMSNKAIDRVKYWGQLLGLPIYWLSFCVPRKKNIWLFGSTFGRRFADNPRYLYLYASQHRDEIQMKNGQAVRPVWISHKKEIVEFLKENGYEAYYYHSLKGIWYCLRGSIYIFDNYSKDISFWLSGGAVKFNLWHGIPLKKIQADNVFDKVRHPKNILDRIKVFPRRLSDEKPSHYVLTTSEKLKPIFKSAFKTENVIVEGYPRNDILLGNKIKNLLTDMEYEEKIYIQNYIKNNKCKMVYYMPTFRESEEDFFEIINLREFEDFLKENNILFCIKLHPKSKLKEAFEEIAGENIFVINQDVDPYVFLKMADMLITDYSSIYFDYLLIDKPIVFFDYDLEKYLNNSRDMYFEYKEFTPGEKVRNQNDLEKEIINGLKDASMYSEFREKMRNQVFKYPGEIGSEKIVKDIMWLLGDEVK